MLNRLFQIIKSLFIRESNWYPWIDIGTLGGNGMAKLLQMRVNLNNNSKIFRRTGIGWVNEIYQDALLKKTMLHTADTEKPEAKVEHA